MKKIMNISVYSLNIILQKYENPFRYLYKF